MLKTAKEFWTAGEYFQNFDPVSFSYLLDPENALKEDTAAATQIAEDLGEPAVMLPGENLPAFRRCVWAIVYP